MWRVRGQWASEAKRVGKGELVCVRPITRARQGLAAAKDANERVPSRRCARVIWEIPFITSALVGGKAGRLAVCRASIL